MMDAMRPPRVLVFSSALALAAAVAAGLSALNAREDPAAAGREVVQRFVVVLTFGALGLFIARESQIPGSLFLASQEWTVALRDILNWGFLPGLVLGVVNYLFFFAYRYSPYLAPQFQAITGVYDSFIISLVTGLTEEVIYRLFILSSLLFSFRRLYEKLTSVWPSTAAIIPVALALVLSSLLFAMRHSYDNFTAAFVGGMLLGWIYVRSGIESAIAGHFAANFLFYSASYLS